MCVQHTEYILEQRRCKNNATIVKKNTTTQQP